jgi:FkbM family methyltransferase
MIPYTDNMRYDYPLKAESMVVNIGGYHGDWAAEIHRRYNCKVWIFEPCFEFYRKIKERFCDVPKIKVAAAAVTDTNGSSVIRWKGDMTGLFSDGEPQEVATVSILDVLDRASPIALLELNCEGSEFAILEQLLKDERMALIENLQVQFHGVVPEAEKRYEAIRDGLLKTHKLTYDVPWCWQNFERL